MLRRRVPTAPFILILTDRSSLETRAAIRLGRAGIRTGLVVGGDVDAILREDLANPLSLGADVREWIEMVRGPIPASPALFIEEIFDRPWVNRNLQTFTASLGVRLWRISRQLRRRGLPTPAAWRRAARALDVALRIQRTSPDLPTLAAEVGYSDPLSISRLVTRGLSASVREIRGTVGWEWLLDYLFQRRLRQWHRGLSGQSRRHSGRRGTV